MDDGNLTDGQGNVINFKTQLFVRQTLVLVTVQTKNTMIIMQEMKNLPS